MSDSISFDRAAGYYDATRGFDPERERQVIDGLAGVLGHLERPVLELGIGTGRIGIPLQQRGYRYYGIDLSWPMLARLRVNAAGRGARVPLVQGDITQLPFPAGTFGAVLSVHVLHLVGQWRAALAEARRVLGARGRIVHAGHRPVAGDDTPSPMMGAWWRLLAEEGYTADRGGNVRVAPQVDAELAALGATAIETVVATHWTNTASPHQVYDRLAGRQWSSTWQIPDAVFARALPRLAEWARAEYGARCDLPETTEEEFYITSARFS